MRIEVNEHGSDAFYKEVANVSMQYKRITKKPTRKLSDIYKMVKVYIVILGLAGLFELLVSVMYGFDGVGTALLIIVAFLMLIYILHYRRIKKYLNTIISDKRQSILTLDEQYIEVAKGADQAIRLGWDNVAFARVFEESICFFSKEAPAIVISVDRPNMDAVVDYIKSKNIGVMIYGV